MDFVLLEETGGDPEGGYVDHPSDPGGATKWGISQRAYPDLDIPGLTKEQALDLYRLSYWGPIGGDQLRGGFPVQLSLLDFAVHSGPRQAVKALQRTLNASPDGVVGPRTLNALEELEAHLGGHAIAMLLLERRVRFLARLVQRSPKLAAFLGGWWMRTVRLQTAIERS